MNTYKHWKEIEDIIDKALDLQLERQVDFIKEKCRHNPDLLKETLNYYSSIKSAKNTSFLEQESRAYSDLLGDPELSQQDNDVTENIIGSTVGPYQIRKLLGEGGMGAVYLAERIDGEFDRYIAIKFLRSGFYSAYMRKRFKNEKRILSKLDHPNITRLLDGGIIEDGTPFLTMEYVDGLPIDEYCNMSNLGIEERLNIFLQICDAVQYAHSNLIIHRDLKPQNILVNTKGQVKVMDFGIAKFLNPDSEEEHLPKTRDGQLIASFNFAAPEQFRAEDQTVATDVYGLGVLLYLLLTGEHPHQFEDYSISEIERTIQHKEPKIPSQVSSHEIGPVSPDLDAIIMKALRKNPTERYTSIQEFSNDIHRYLNHRPVLAQKRSNIYKINKFIVRNRSVLAASFLVLITLSGILFYHFQAIGQQVERAELEAEKASRVTEFMTDLFNANDPYLPDYTEGDPTARQVLENAALSIEAELSDEPELYAELHSVIGKSLFRIAQYDLAKVSLNNSINTLVELQGSDNPLLISNKFIMANINITEGNRDSAKTWISKAMNISLDSDNESYARLAEMYDLLGSIYANNLEYEIALTHYEIALIFRREILSENRVREAMTLSNLAELQFYVQDFENAKINLYESLDILINELGENHITIANIYGKLGSLYRMDSDFDMAEEYLVRTIESKTDLLTENHPSLITTYNSYGLTLQQMGKHEAAKKQLEKSIALFEATEQTDSLTLGIYLNNLALAKMSLGQLKEALTLHNDILSIKEQHLEPDNPSITITLYNRAHLFQRMNNLEEAEKLFEEVVDRDKQYFGPNHPEVAVDLVKLASVYRDRNKFEKAENSFQEAQRIFDERFPENHFRVGEFYLEYGKLKVMKKNCYEAQSVLEKSLSIFKESLDDDHENIASANHYLTECLTAQL